MNILYLDWPCFGRDDSIYALEQMGHKVVPFCHTDYEELESENFRQAFSQAVDKNNITVCFSYNYFPLMAKCCHEEEVKYISLIYDSPYAKLYSYTIIFPTNYVFVFDKILVEELRTNGINTVHYAVLPVDSTHILQINSKQYPMDKLSSDVSFVGALYNEQHNLFERISGKDEYLDGYLSGIMDAQRKVWGYNFIEESLTQDILKRLHDVDPYQPNAESAVTDSYIYSNYYINRKITQLERAEYLSAVGEKFDIKLFTLDAKAKLPNVRNMGPCYYNSEMPLIFNNSKINLNITLRSIRTGIPLRCMDIIGAGGFLLSNYQQDLAEAFVSGEEFVYYESKEDMLDKIEYYLGHEKERAEIAENGWKKTKEEYSFFKCFERMFQTVLN